MPRTLPQINKTTKVHFNASTSIPSMDEHFMKMFLQ
jgi:hypothetical protein